MSCLSWRKGGGLPAGVLTAAQSGLSCRKGNGGTGCHVVRGVEFSYERYYEPPAIALTAAQSGLSCRKGGGQPAGGLTAWNPSYEDPPWLLWRQIRVFWNPPLLLWRLEAEFETRHCSYGDSVRTELP